MALLGHVKVKSQGTMAPLVLQQPCAHFFVVGQESHGVMEQFELLTQHPQPHVGGGGGGNHGGGGEGGEPPMLCFCFYYWNIFLSIFLT